ncbi:multifunctional aminopeptidase A [Neobacillus bataviensis LMG 21833]|uniref:Probable cytosol aminopeptidase n=2 Tax=Neobacillus bataviensis TaxID=220685 RepID=K6DTS3_9BACI|nr:multifunctional aminopeptidase A [Neobacillus bataviensis LMG 21833]
MLVQRVQNYQKDLYDTMIIPFTTPVTVVSKEIRMLKGHISASSFSGKSQEIYQFTHVDGDKSVNVILLGLGQPEQLKHETIYQVFAKGFSSCRKLQSENAIVFYDNITGEVGNEVIAEKAFEAAYLANYTFEKYKTAKSEKAETRVDFLSKNENLDHALLEAQHCATGTMMARNLINEPPNYMTPSKLAEEAKKVGEEANFNVTVYDAAEIEKLGMNLFLAVGKGSAHQPAFIVMEHFGDPDSDRKVGMVGKGITFDTGGYSLKSEASMTNMHGDMGGAAAVIGAMKVISEMKLKINVVAVVAACENRVSDKSYLPGDIVQSMSGKFVEVNNTDAEGRLTLADAITYLIQKHDVGCVIDIATLTGAVIDALGKRIAGFFTNDSVIRSVMNEASHRSMERIWELPFDDGLRSVIQSDVADLKNSAFGSNKGGYAIVAALFISEFVENRPWVHLDIAGTSWSTEELDDCPKGGVGYGVRLLYHVVKILERDQV